ncbi:PREDICTED: uncharacterized protein LOC108527073 [Rhinopithecus bieti]|uniref:uncharacterized protein LOC108527073 n=1 Tax=Rhinopithecus bieti TaxID=61621 RepID=UPI00083C6379|nr:PREDICTED: uncharacterized protein LOC108527073 [Rhinopithecus bieti]
MFLNFVSAREEKIKKQTNKQTKNQKTNEEETGTRRFGTRDPGTGAAQAHFGKKSSESSCTQKFLRLRKKPSVWGKIWDPCLHPAAWTLTKQMMQRSNQKAWPAAHFQGSFLGRECTILGIKNCF